MSIVTIAKGKPCSRGDGELPTRLMRNPLNPEPRTVAAAGAGNLYAQCTTAPSPDRVSNSVLPAFTIRSHTR